MVLGAIYHYLMNTKGLSLVEIVISFVVLSIVALGATATVAVIGGDQVRMSGGSTLELQALNYARETLESLRNDVRGTLEEAWYADNTTAWDLADNSYPVPCTAPIGTPCSAGLGWEHIPAGAGLTNGLPTCTAGSPATNLQCRGGRRHYYVQDISSGVGIAGMDVAYKRVTVQVDQWTD